MTKQLTLISVPADPQRQDRATGSGDEGTGDDSVDHSPEDRVGLATAGDTQAEHVPAGGRSEGPVQAVAGAQRRSAEHQGWLDRRTITTGRRGVAAARAALADANRRVAARHEQEDADRQARLVSSAEQLVRDAGHAA